MLEIEKVKKYFEILKQYEFEAELYIALLLNEKFASASLITEEIVEKIYELAVEKDSIFDSELVVGTDKILYGEVQ